VAAAVAACKRYSIAALRCAAAAAADGASHLWECTTRVHVPACYQARSLHTYALLLRIFRLWVPGSVRAACY